MLTISLTFKDAHHFARYVSSCLDSIGRAELCQYKLKKLCPVADLNGWNGIPGRRKKKEEGVN